MAVYLISLNHVKSGVISDLKIGCDWLVRNVRKHPSLTSTFLMDVNNTRSSQHLGPIWAAITGMGQCENVTGWTRGDFITQSPSYSIPDIGHSRLSGSSAPCLLLIVFSPPIVMTLSGPMWLRWQPAEKCSDTCIGRTIFTIHGTKIAPFPCKIWRIVWGGDWWSLYNVMLMLASCIYWLAVDIISWVLPIPVPVMHCPISDHTGAGARNYWPEPEPGEVKWGYCIQMTRDTGEAWPGSRDSICIVMSQ